MDKFLNIIVGAEFRTVIEQRPRSILPCKRSRVSEANELDWITDIHHKNGQWSLALLGLTDDESQDIASWFWNLRRSME